MYNQKLKNWFSDPTWRFGDVKTSSLDSEFFFRIIFLAMMSTKQNKHTDHCSALWAAFGSLFVAKKPYTGMYSQWTFRSCGK